MKQSEENPFNDPQVAVEWIKSVENEKDMSRDRIIYPYLKGWANDFDASKTVIEIGSGQGICSEKLESPAHYIGIEPSTFLVERAKQKYAAPNRSFLEGDAYHLPISSASADRAFSVNVWLHIENLASGSEELNRILKPRGKFLIITFNPSAYDVWETYYDSAQKEGKRLTGRALVPINPLSRNILHEHSLKEMVEGLEAAGLVVETAEEIGTNHKETGKRLFMAIHGHAQ